MGLEYAPPDIRMSSHLLMPLLVGGVYGSLLLMLLLSLYFILRHCSRRRRVKSSAGFKGRGTHVVQDGMATTVSHPPLGASQDVALMTLIPRRWPPQRKEGVGDGAVKENTIIDIEKEMGDAARSSRSNNRPASDHVIYVPYTFAAASSARSSHGKSRDVCLRSRVTCPKQRSATSTSRQSKLSRHPSPVSFAVISPESLVDRTATAKLKDNQKREVTTISMSPVRPPSLRSEKKPATQCTPPSAPRDQRVRQLDDRSKIRAWEEDGEQRVFASFTKTPPFMRLSSTNLAVPRALALRSSCGGPCCEVTSKSEYGVYTSENLPRHNCLSPLCTPYGCSCLAHRDNKCRHCYRHRTQCVLCINRCCHRHGLGSSAHDVKAAKKHAQALKEHKYYSDLERHRLKRKRSSACPTDHNPGSRSHPREATHTAGAGTAHLHCSSPDVQVLVHSASAMQSDELVHADVKETSADSNPVKLELPEKQLLITLADSQHLSDGDTAGVLQQRSGSADKNVASSLGVAAPPASDLVSSRARTLSQELSVCQQFPEDQACMDVSGNLLSYHLNIDDNDDEDGDRMKSHLSLVKEQLWDLQVHHPGKTKFL